MVESLSAPSRIPVNDQSVEDTLHRAVIEQAKGILMAAERCSADEAFDILVAASQRENVKLRLIAQRIVERATTAEPARPATGNDE